MKLTDNTLICFYFLSVAQGNKREKSDLDKYRKGLYKAMKNYIHGRYCQEENGLSATVRAARRRSDDRNLLILGIDIRLYYRNHSLQHLKRQRRGKTESVG